MADQKLTALTALTTPISTDEMYIVDDPDSTPLSRRIDLRYIIGTGDSGANLIKNSPGQIVTDGAEPQWWEDVVTATITDEDAVGEGIPDKTERVFKVVTTADDVYGFQHLTFADEELLDAGTTVVSLSCSVYCGTADKASIGIDGTNLGLQESSQAGASAWELLTVENITVDVADTRITIEFIVDTDTAYFTMPMVNLGSRALAWQPRGQKFVAPARATQYDLDTTGDVAWSNTDCTANTDPLATSIQVYPYILEADGAAGSTHQIGHNDIIVGSDNAIVVATSTVVGIAGYSSCSRVECNASQVIRYKVEEVDADADVIARLYITGYWMWA